MLRLYNSFQMLQPTIEALQYLIHLEGSLPDLHFLQALQLCPDYDCKVVIIHVTSQAIQYFMIATFVQIQNEELCLST